MPIKTKLSLLLITCIAVPLGLAVGVSVFDARWALRQARVAALEAVVELKVTRIRDFLQERRADMLQLSQAPELQDFLVLASRRGSRPSGPEYLVRSARLTQHLHGLKDGYPYSDIIVTTPDGRAVYCGSPRYEACRVGVIRAPERSGFAADREGVRLSDIIHDPVGAGRIPRMRLDAPVRDQAGRLLGAVCISFAMDRIYGIIQDNTGLGQTGETVLGRRSAEGIVILAPTRHDPGALFKIFTRRESGGSRTFPIQLAVGRQPGSGWATDYRGELVLAAWRYIPELDWGLVAKIDAAEAFAPVWGLMWMTLLLALFLFGLGALAASFASELFTSPLRELQKGAQAIGQGRLDYAIKVSSEDELGQLARAFNRMAQDIKEGTAAIRQAKEEWERTFHAVPDLIAVLDDRHYIRRVNKAMAERLGLSPEALAGRPCHELVHGDCHPPATCPHVATCADGKEHFGEVHEERLGGDFLISTTPIFDERGRVAGSVHVARDITERKKAESALRDVAKLRTDLISLVNHEYANGLTNMKLALALLRGAESGTPGDERNYAYEVLERTVGKLTAYTNNFLNLHRMESGKFELDFQPIAIRSVLFDDLLTLRPLAEAKQQTLSIQAGFPDNLPVAVRADPDCLSLIINNLVTNAVKYTPNGGRIAIHVELAPKPANRVRLIIEDTGIGLSVQDQQRILAGFYRSKEGKRVAGGFGVGLMLVRKLIEQHGSRLEIESEPGKGSRFSFSLPVWTQAPDSKAPIPAC